MENTVVQETMDIFKKLTPKNQSYFMTLVRLAEVAENAVRHQEAARYPYNGMEPGAKHLS